MAHQRQTIRTAVKAALVAGVALATPRVFVAMSLPLRESQLPAITIWTPSDKTKEDSVQSSGIRELDLDLVVEVTAWVADTGDNDEATANALDALCAQIETAMDADPFFGDPPDSNAAANSFLNGTALDLADVGERMMGRAVMEYEFLYRTSSPVAPTGLDDLDTGHTEIVHSDDANDAQDTFATS